MIAHDNDVVVFVEVKVRSSSAFGTERDMINSQKQNRLSRAAEAYIMQKIIVEKSGLMSLPL